MTSQPAQPDADGYRPLAELRHAGLLWLLNRTALHPRGLALAFCVDDQGNTQGWTLQRSPDGEPWAFDPAVDADGYRRAEATLAAALAEPAVAPPAAAELPLADTLTSAVCICGAPVVYLLGRPGAHEWGWTHSSDAGRSCQRARPRCPECQMPHALLPGEPPMCRGLLEHVTGRTGTEGTDSQHSAGAAVDDPAAPASPLTDVTDRDSGVRIEYRAQVPRHLMGAAIAEAFGIIATGTAGATHPPEGTDR
ncbi:hypothetical protein QFZ66_005845 [Streptomyces sp. B4I13]|uniref:hypothetical protein n=1 Tax=Streptomyces sp. B4I13 TaxID=3042271 RepID=UPI0027848752|nr:hypothetical protein [Streptomyces sp. B4I13]MDQ0961967.1 hypothetical protein [Streptomyces sp. B4I13]